MVAVYVGRGQVRGVLGRIVVDFFFFFLFVEMKVYGQIRTEEELSSHRRVEEFNLVRELVLRFTIDVKMNVLSTTKVT